MIDRVGQRFGDYRLIRLLGKGGFAEVYLGEHQRLKLQAAIKVLKVHLTNKELDEFLSEVRTFRLKHPNIVPVLNFGVEGGTIPFIVMGYAPNGTLRDRISHHTPACACSLSHSKSK